MPRIELVDYFDQLMVTSPGHRTQPLKFRFVLAGQTAGLLASETTRIQSTENLKVQKSLRSHCYYYDLENVDQAATTHRFFTSTATGTGPCQEVESIIWLRSRISSGTMSDFARLRLSPSSANSGQVFLMYARIVERSDS